jgi:UDP-3-O-[3-hydroxymyristoyl] glucosamine N-acyltransferase
MKRSLQQIAEAVEGRVQGDGSVEVGSVASIGSATRHDLVFVEEEKYLQRALQSGAGAVIAGEFAAASSGKPLLISRHPKLTFARAARFLQKGTREESNSGIPATAVVHTSARLAPGVVVAEYGVVGADAEIGEGTRIGAGCAIGRGVKLGRECEIYPKVTIYAGTTLGDRVVVHAGAVLGSDGFGYVRDAKSGKYEKFPQVGTLVIEDDVEIGANTTIDRGALDETRIGQGTKIDNLVHIGHNCDIGEDVILVAMTGISGSCTVGNGAVIAGQVGLGDHAHVGPGVILGGQAGVLSGKTVTNDGLKPGTVLWGTPARPLMQVLREQATLARLTKLTRKVTSKPDDEAKS